MNLPLSATTAPFGCVKESMPTTVITMARTEGDAAAVTRSTVHDLVFSESD
jgi:hypothetical protein